MSAPEVTEEKPAVEQPTIETAAPMETDASATTDVKPEETTVPETKTEETSAVVPEFPEALRGKTDEEINEIKKGIVERLTFYFSDSNLFYDKFLWTLVCKSPEGWVPLETVASFKRMRDYLQTYGLPFIAQAVRDIHPVSGQEGNEIEVDVEGKQVRRTKSLEKDTSAWDRTVYVKGFGAGETGKNSQEQVEAWFKQFGPVAAVRFRREGEGKERGRGPFKGSVFAEFRLLADAQKFVDMEPKPEFDGTPVTAMFKEKYVTDKVIEKGIDKSQIQRRDNAGAGKQFNAFREIEMMKQKGEKLPDYVMNMGTAALLDTSHVGQLKRKRDGEDNEGNDRAEKKPSKESQALTITYNNKQIAVNRATGVVIDKTEIEFAPGRVLRFENAGPEADWKTLKQDLQNLGFEKSFMNFPRGSTWGWFSLEEPISDEDFEKIKDAKLQAGGELQWSRVTGDEEVEFWAARASFQGKLAVKQADEKDAQRAEFSRDGRGRGRGGRGGQRGGRGRGGRGGRGGNRGGKGGRAGESSQPASSSMTSAPPAI